MKCVFVSQLLIAVYIRTVSKELHAHGELVDEILLHVSTKCIDVFRRVGKIVEEQAYGGFTKKRNENLKLGKRLEC
jgi:hypothetical protein